MADLPLETFSFALISDFLADVGLSKSLEIMVGFGHPTARLEASEFNVNL
jgi:hypothetical protein